MNSALATTSSARLSTDIRPASTTGRSTVCSAPGPPGGKPRLSLLKLPSDPVPVISSPSWTTNRVVALTSGSDSIADQSKPGWLGTTVMVAGSVTAHSRSKALSPRRAPATAVRTVPTVSATSSATTTSDRHRRRASRRSQVTAIGLPNQGGAIRDNGVRTTGHGEGSPTPRARDEYSQPTF